MRLTRRATALSVAALLVSPVLASAATPDQQSAPRFQPWLEQHLTEVAAGTPLRVMVRATSIDAAVAATQAAGLTVQQQWPLVDIAVGLGTPAQVRALRDRREVIYVEGDTPLSYSLDTAHQATRSDEALQTYSDATGAQVDGAGVTIAIIDSGIDGTHPFFAQDGVSKVVQNRKNACGIDLAIDPTLSEACFVSAPDTDTISGGGHGTHVAGIAAGVAVTTAVPAGRKLRGSAPGAKLVGLSVGAAIGLLDAAAAQNWVLEHQQNPCRTAAEQTGSEVDVDCPPIRVTNHSYGPIATEGEDQSFDQESASVQLQRALVDKGVVAVWAAGNDGGDGSYAATNPDAMDPTAGIVMVASYNDAQTGSRDNALSSFSSRGKDGAPGTYPDVSAPGDLITSSCRAYLTVCATGLDPVDGGSYNTISGTSMASPYIAGVVAQLFAANPALTPGQVEDLLEDTAHKFTAGAGYEADPLNTDDTTSFDKGHGLVDVLAALAAEQGLPAPGEPAPSCTVGSFQVLDPAGDAVQVAVGDTPLPSSPSLDIQTAWMSWEATAQEMTFHLEVTDLSAGPPDGAIGEYFRFYLTREGDAETYIVANRRPAGVGNRFSLNQYDSGATTPLTGTFDEATSTVTVVLPAAGYTAVIPGASLTDGDTLAVGQVLGQRDNGQLTLTADTATGSCPFQVGTSTPGV